MDDDSDDEVHSYSGMTNIDKQPHGRGTMTFVNGHRFEGRFRNGEKDGRGCFYFEDGSSLEGRYVNNNVEGLARYTLSDGSYIVGLFQNGELNGSATHYDCKGNMIFQGQYKSNVEVGLCRRFDHFNGSIIGIVDEDGKFTGDELAYIYPDERTALFGSFKDSKLVFGRAAYFDGIHEGKPLFSLIESERRSYTFDESTSTCISCYPLLPDPYEQSRVYVAPSLIPEGNEGLFSKCAVCEGEVMSFYNGIRLCHQEVDDRLWRYNDNTISLNETTVIDVPERYAKVDNYCASLGHKANHSLTPNCKYDIYEHPRFGSIKCIRTIKPVFANEELTVDYGYTKKDGVLEAPNWYKKLLPSK